MNASHYRRRQLRYYFPIIVLFAFGAILAPAIAVERFDPRASVAVCAVGIALFVTYYLVYFVGYRRLKKSLWYQKRDFYYAIYDFWSILTFNALFLIMFSLFLDSIHRLVPFFEPASLCSFFNVFLLSIQQIVDSLSLGCLSSFGLQFTELKVQQHWWGKTLFFVYKITIDVTIILAVQRECYSRRKESQELEKLKATPVDQSCVFLSPDSEKAPVLERYLRENWNNEVVRKNCLSILMKTNSRSARDAVLMALQRPNDLWEFESFVNYLILHNERRLWRVARAIKDPKKKQILRDKKILRS